MGTSGVRYAMNIITFQMVHPRIILLLIAAGEDVIYRCTSCEYAKNAELHELDERSQIKCPKCHKETLYTSSAIELGHTFYLGTKYSTVFNATYTPKYDPSRSDLIHMGCYGLGISRMIAAIVEVSHDESGILWPESVAPWKCVILQDKEGSAEPVYDGIASVIGQNDVLLDDRLHVSVGHRVQDAKRMGYPWIVVMARTWESTGLLEVIKRKTGETMQVDRSAILDPKFWSA